MEIYDEPSQHGASILKTPKPKVLILTSYTGGGHVTLAQSIKDILGDNYETDFAFPLPSIIHRYYTWTERHAFNIWELSFNVSDNEQAALRIHKIVASLIHKRLLALIEQSKPQLIISIHPFLHYSIARVNEEISQRIPLVFLLPELDYIHSAWLTEKTGDAYLMPTREIFNQVFLQGGGEGTAGIDRTVNSMLASDTPIQIILATGTNKRLAARYSGIANLRALPYVETIAPYMAAADLVAGKAGPTFMYETIMLEKPFLATFYIPGQETLNLRFIERNNLGWVCLEAEAQKQLITGLASDPDIMAEKVTSIRAFRAWNMQMNQAVYPLIERLVQKQRSA